MTQSKSIFPYIETGRTFFLIGIIRNILVQKD
jgi:hypothetical protein